MLELDKLMPNVAKVFFIVGGLFILLGILFSLGDKVPWLGRLPGDIRVEREHYRFYFPLVTCLVISILLSLALYVLRRFS